MEEEAEREEVEAEEGDRRKEIEGEGRK